MIKNPNTEITLLIATSIVKLLSNKSVVTVKSSIYNFAVTADNKGRKSQKAT